MNKVTKITLRVISKCHAHLRSLNKTPAKFQKDWDKIVEGVALTRYRMYISSVVVEPKNDQVQTVKKVTKITLRVISKCHAHLRSLNKTPVKFQKDWDKIVEGVALTRYISSVVVEPKNDQVQTVKKVTKITLRVISKCHVHFQSLTKTPVKFQKDWDKIVGGVALTRYLMSISFSSS